MDPQVATQTAPATDDRTELPHLHLRADVQAGSVDEEARTFEVVFSTGADVDRFDWFRGEKYIESLSLKPGHVRMERLNDGAPFLNTHSAWSLDDVLGVVVAGSAKLVDGQARATIRFSRRAGAEPVWQDVKDGIVRNVSVGYRVHKYVKTEGENGKPARRHATDWEPYEISAVPMGADAGAHVRQEGATTFPCLIEMRAPGGGTTMEPTQPQVRTETGTSTQPAAALPPATEVAEQVGTERTESDAARDAERARVQGIIRACRAARLPQSFADKLIADGVDLLRAQDLVLESLERGPGGATLTERGPGQGPSRAVAVMGADPLENVWRGIKGALLHRVDPVAWPMDDNAKQYRMHSLLRAAEECLEQRGVRTRGLSKLEICNYALGLDQRGGLHGTGDFSNILADVANKSLRRAYDEAPQTFMPIARRIEAPDFKALKRNQLGEAPALAKVLPSGEYQRGTIAEGKEQFALATYGKIFGINRVALINDDLDAFGRLTTMFGRSARNLESDLVWAEILRNANMGDGVALFATAHGNFTSSGTAISVDSLGVARALMRNQKGLDAKTYLNLSARYLIVPPGKETLADQFTTVITPQQGSNVNPFAGRLTVLSEPRLEGGIILDQHTPESISGSATAWYLAADPSQIDIIEWAVLAGEPGPVVESRVGFDVDGLEVKCRHDVAAKVIDHRGVYKNNGA